MKIKSVLSIIFLVMLIVGGCGTNEQSQPDKDDEKQPAQEIEDNPIATITMENNDTIKVELYPNIAPNTVNNFISLAESGFYDGLIFHRVIPGFMIQGGDPEGRGTGGPGYAIKGEFESNGVDNELNHERGVLSMARSQDPDSAGSQFFIMVAEATHLDGEYAAFGKVTEGMDAVDKIVNVEKDNQDKPLEDQKIKQITVETFGVEFPEPEKIE
ncbi:peptidylprolyl isomerase [Metabacillus litoralis]|uniref:peptidylprolyl isomerase n=1 Tax=Metabacillus TaxID=2675233 RepID=UPI001B9191F8|nr:peptidylprolyl isomerase [Metabacillus litoralis]UHA58350.1 peptidylprolyl isomerase [Metabacillus litoralis]